MATPKISRALLETREAINQIEALTGKEDFTKRDEARVHGLLAKIAALRDGNIAPNNAAKRWLVDFLKGSQMPQESRATDLFAGTQSISYTEGAAGGFFVPQEISDFVMLGLAQWDPLLDGDVVTLVESKDFSLRPYTQPGWDLSTFAASKIAEGVQQNPQTVPSVATKLLNSYTYRCTLDASFEFEEDTFQPTMDLMQLAYAIGFARGIGVDLAEGNGSTAPQGVINGASNSGISTGSVSSATLNDIESIYFSVDRIYRAMPKCAWVFSDAYYEQIRKATDSVGNPLLKVIKDKETLMGKPVYVSPSMPVATATPGIVFGDLSHFVVRVSKMILKRNLQAAGYVENGKGLYTGLLRADSKVVDPTGGTKPPIVYATFV